MNELPSELATTASSAKTLGTIRQRLVARLAPEILNPFDRTPEREATLRAAIGAILEDPELDLAATPPMIAAVEAAVCGLGRLQPLVEDVEVSDILVNAPDEIFAERAGRLEATEVTLGSADELVEIAQRIALAGELSAHPIVDARCRRQRSTPSSAGRRPYRDPQVQPPRLDLSPAAATAATGD
jgi:pilus assembly protein CpaF